MVVLEVAAAVLITDAIGIVISSYNKHVHAEGIYLYIYYYILARP